MHKLITDDALWEIFNAERTKAWDSVDAEVGSPEWEQAAAKIDVINNICHAVMKMDGAKRTPSDEAKKPVWKSAESVIHETLANGTGRFRKEQWAAWVCPVCEWFVGEQYRPTWAKAHNQSKCNFCSRCGQRIDWEGVEEP